MRFPPHDAEIKIRQVCDSPDRTEFCILKVLVGQMAWGPFLGRG